MITVERDEQCAIFKVRIVVPFHGERIYTFRYNCGSEEYAGFLAGAIRSALQRTLEAVREKAYLQGYKDAKAKRAKAQFFESSL